MTKELGDLVEAEQLFMMGKISAKEFGKRLNRIRLRHNLKLKLRRGRR